MVDFFKVIIYEPLYNGLVFLVGVVPFGDLGLAVIILTILVRLVLFPLSHKSTKTQARMRTLEPEVREIKERYKNDKQEQAKKTMELYQKHGMNPFSGCMLLVVQLPVIISLYFVFYGGLSSGLDQKILYSFVRPPEFFNPIFLGFIDLLGKSFLLAAGAGISQYFHMTLALPAIYKKKTQEPSFRDDLAKSFNVQMRYGLPVFVFFISYKISAAVALYWLTTNLFSIGHELYVRRETNLLTNTSAMAKFGARQNNEPKQ